MEDIDKNGDGFIDLEEYIGETLVLVLHVLSVSPQCPHPVAATAAVSFPALPFRECASLSQLPPAPTPPLRISR